MYSPTMIIVTSRIGDLHAESAANRLAAQAKSSRKGPSRLASVASGIRSLLGSAEAPVALPKLSDYPYRS